MSGSDNQSKTSQPKLIQLPLTGFSVEYVDERTGRKYRIQAMGDGRYRIHTRKRQPQQK